MIKTNTYEKTRRKDTVKQIDLISPAKNLKSVPKNVMESQKNAGKHCIDQDPVIEYQVYLLHMQERLSQLQNILNEKSSLATCVKWYPVKDDECVWVDLIAVEGSQLYLVDKEGNYLKDDFGCTVKLYGIAGDFDEACDKLLEKLNYLDRGYMLKAVGQKEWLFHSVLHTNQC